MKRRKFQLESVLNYRKSLEEKARVEFLKIKEDLDAEEKRLSKLTSEREKYEEDLKWRKMRPADPREFDLYHHYLQRMEGEIEIQRKRVREAMERYDDQKEILLTVAREKKIVEKLKEKEENVAAYRMKREDKKSMDECAQGGYLRDGK